METPKAKAVMAEYLKKHKVDAYFEAYRARRHNNHCVLMEVAEKLVAMGYDCYTARDYYECETSEFIYVLKDNMGTTFGFGEVPFRWYVGSSVSGPSGLARINGYVDSYAFPFGIEDILEQMEPIRFTNRFESDFYVKLGEFDPTKLKYG